MSWWQLLLYPFSLLYESVTSLRNRLFDSESWPSFQFEANVIAVGNLSVGGTGKSPMIAWLIDYLHSKGLSIATLSRGYGRNTSGFLIADETGDWQHIGDEPAMLKHRYPEAMITVGEDRTLSIPMILGERPATDVILLDDAFQHRSVIPSFSILMTTYQRPFYDDVVMPSGRLRESKTGASRSDVVIISGCPKKITDSEKKDMTYKVMHYTKHNAVFFTSVDYLPPRPLNGGDPLRNTDSVIAISGIANATLFENEVEDKFSCIKAFRFRDHYPYSRRSIIQIDDYAQSKNASIIFTEKDAIKWIAHLDGIRSLVYVLPMTIKFLEREEEFLSMLNSTLKTYNREYGDV